jgi:RND family efflux transporter MFP subunit
MPDTPPHQDGRGVVPAPTGSITYLEPALWQQLVDAETDRDFCLSWLRLQCRLIDEVHQGVVMMGPADAGPFLPMASWPEQLPLPQVFDNVVQRVLRERKGVVVRFQADLPEAIPDRFHLGYPVKVDNRLHGVVALDIAHRKPEGLQSVMRQLQWGAAWLENRILRKQVGPVEHAQEQLTTTLDLAARALQERDSQGAAMACVTELATRLACDRVSIGFRKQEFIEVAALSHSAQFGGQLNLLQAIGRVMDECCDQGRPVLYPAAETGQGTIIRAHAELAVQHKSAAILTIPLFAPGGSHYGAMTFERGVGPPFELREVELCQAVGALLGPILEEKRRNDRSLPTRLRDSLNAQLHKLWEPGHAAVKVSALTLAALAVFFAFAKGDYRVTAKTVLEGEVQRAITVPFDGYVEEALVRAGDVVRAGQPMARLNDKDLTLERLKWASLKEQHQLEYYKALAGRDHAAAKVYSEQANQAAAELRLLEQQLERARIAAPFDGVVVSGDLSQSLGAPVARGDVLFEVAPLHSYRVMLDVDERDIGALAVGQPGTLVLNALPDQDLPFTVEKITPVSIAREGINYFRVEASLQEPSERLRPGMEGYGKVEADRRHLLWIWTHPLIDWLRLWAWKWTP